MLFVKINYIDFSTPNFSAYSTIFISFSLSSKEKRSFNSVSTVDFLNLVSF